MLPSSLFPRVGDGDVEREVLVSVKGGFFMVEGRWEGGKTNMRSRLLGGQGGVRREGKVKVGSMSFPSPYFGFVYSFLSRSAYLECCFLSRRELIL